MARLSRVLVAVALSAASFTLPAVAHGDSGVYVVQSGDTLIGISTRLGVRLPALLTANDLTVNSVIFPGQRLAVPGTAAGSPAHAGSTYTVIAGNSLSGIAARHNVTLSALLAANRITATTVIHPGQRLTIPGASASGASPSRSPTAPAGSNYTIKAGDTLSGIAARHNVTLSALLTSNGLAVTSVIHPGQRLKIPGATNVGSSASHTPNAPAGSTYTIRSGDTLSGIAARHNVTLSALLKANRLDATSVIHPGRQLILPGGATVSPNASPRSSPVDRVLAYARAQLGKPYRFFTAGPNAFDCSGLTLAAYAQVGIPLIHHSASQARQGTAVDVAREPIRAGDLVFMTTRGATAINHVGIAISSTTWIQARRPGDVVRAGPLPPASMITAVRRFIPSG